MGRFRSEEPIPTGAVKVQVILPKSLHKAIKFAAATQEQSMGRYIGDLLAKNIKKIAASARVD